ncbi:ATP-binding cassette domain-containing protein, partial [Bifidobacterium longum]|nr:ATP-binding cassette domain-containing protein [Bifidobacterium longum]
EGIDDDKRMISYLTEVADNVVDKNGNRVNVTQLLERFLFPRFMHGTLIRKLSGGEKRRLYLLKILMQQPNVLLL